MDYIVRHITQFRYSAPITESVMEVRMQPRRDDRQHCLSFELRTEPRTRITASRDYLGNIVHHFDVPQEHQTLLITAMALVTLMPSPSPQALPADAWDDLDTQVAQDDYAEMLIPSRFAHPTPLLRQFAAEVGAERRADPFSLVRDLSAGVHNALLYTPQATRVDSPLDDALRMRQGVCQDYTHILIALVRELGIPCRYCSGYLYRHVNNPGQARADATHAWVEAWLPQIGWVGFDPTNNVVVGDRHIKVAVGRDYADVPPTRGVFKGTAATELGVAVQVVPADAKLADDELLLVMQPMSSPAHPGEQPEQQQQVENKEPRTENKR